MKVRAFPSVAVDDRYGGMQLRDWFAGQIAAAYCTATDNTGMWMTTADEVGAREIAKRSYAVADAMMAHREKRHDT